VTDKIVPPPELVNQWCHEDGDEIKTSPRWFRSVCAKAAQWGADQELQACCEHIRDYQWGFVDRPDGIKMHRAVDLKIARRPSPPSLKQQALAVLNDSANRLDGAHENIIRRALEALDE
jgi:hypothetical protein